MPLHTISAETGLRGLQAFNVTHRHRMGLLLSLNFGGTVYGIEHRVHESTLLMRVQMLGRRKTPRQMNTFSQQKVCKPYAQIF